MPLRHTSAKCFLRRNFPLWTWSLGRALLLPTSSNVCTEGFFERSSIRLANKYFCNHFLSGGHNPARQSNKTSRTVRRAGPNPQNEPLFLTELLLVRSRLLPRSSNFYAGKFFGQSPPRLTKLTYALKLLPVGPRTPPDNHILDFLSCFGRVPNPTGAITIL